MDLHFPTETLKAVKAAGCKSEALKETDEWRRTTSIDSELLEVSDFELIKRIVKKPELWEHIENRRIYKKIETIETLKSGLKDVKISRLEVLAQAIRSFLQPTPHKWVFLNDTEYNSVLPWFVCNAEYNPPERGRDYYRPAQVKVELKAMLRGSERDRTIVFRSEDLGGTVEETLRKAEAFVETDKMVKDYEAEVKKYRREAPKTGEQYVAKGDGQVVDGRRWHSGLEPFEKDGVPAKVVMDDGCEQGSHPGFESTGFWLKGKGGKKREFDEENEKAYRLPVHPVVRVFNLGTHEYVDCHIGNVEPYQYDTKVIKKLVLPEDHQELVDALTGSAVRKMDDIIKGKATGVIILCSGKPGTGKTLTAEVYSEAAKRPLYMVQCSQLGTNETKLEENLEEVLDRATRWRAILLIDEADVYIHERGESINQNAIVGVFLRVLEYYRGILFMNTNRVTVVDDAILSRATAHIKYNILEDPKDCERLWQVLLDQYEVDLPVAEAMKAFPKISGRSIRQLIRLAKVMADRSGKAVTVDSLKWAAKFHDFTEKE